MFLKTTAAALLGLLISSSALADQMGPNGDKFYEEAAHYEHACQTEPCKTPYSEVVVYDQKMNINKIEVATKAALKEIAVAQAQIWGDTILEGDYHASGRTRLDSVLAFYKGNALIGFKIQYSEKAWYTGECGFNGKRESLKGCQEGRIVEGSYVSADTQTYFSDEERYAEFSFVQN
ncbi:hypothetical protein QJS83_01575 [Bdellovibrio sp. 22V]|uniref:hypothetical protein n=1 Tax=Bdellovibrio TaxID=958 RepID=UPI00254333AD|nr:hypothetical protein [Bdellovibrio sp. 22V]WII72559.1 hypothetical protein QJS83_01575 [Bdellovibrio sp. 22V]